MYRSVLGIDADCVKLIRLYLLTAKYPGAKDFVVTVREKLSDSTLKECIFYAGTTEFLQIIRLPR